MCILVLFGGLTLLAQAPAGSVVPAVRVKLTNLETKQAPGRYAITERTAMQFRWETFNLSNRANFNLPLTQVDVLAGGTMSTARGARVHQLGLRLEF